MKALRTIKSLATLAIVFFTVACSNQELNNEITGEGEAEITIKEESFSSDKAVTRSLKPTIKEVDLGDGLVAEVSIEPTKEQNKPTTRAALANGHYTIYAFDASGNKKATLLGTVNGTSFVRDAGTPKMKLGAGTYTFVCVNDVVSFQNGKFEVSRNTTNPLIGVTTQTITNSSISVSFVMKHQSARIKTKITSYTNEGKNIKTHISSTDVQPEIDRYNVDGNTLSGTATSALSATSNVFIVAENAVTASPYVQTIERESDYQYFLPQTDGSKLTLSFESGSKIYGKDLSSKTLNLSALGILDKNGSYTVNVKLKTFPYYLYHDGTVGTIGDKGTREPIGIVLTEKTTTEKGLAIALKDASAGRDGIGPGYYMYFLKDEGGFNNMNGYDITWTTNYYNTYNIANQNGGTVPSEYNTYAPGEMLNGIYPVFPAYYAAAHYNAGVTITGSNVGKWFLGSSGQWVLMCEKLGGLNQASLPSSFTDDEGGIYFVPSSTAWDGNKARTYFTQAGGDLSLSTGTTPYTATVYGMSGSYNGYPIFIRLEANSTAYIYDYMVVNTPCLARAFVNF